MKNIVKFSEVKIVNDTLVTTKIKIIKQSQLTSDCFFIQFNGLDACKNCELLHKKDCGGKNIRKKLLAQ